MANTVPTIAVDDDQIATEGVAVELLSTTLNDGGTADTHTATVEWGDGTRTTEAEVVEEPFGPAGTAAGLTGSVHADHVYADDGEYIVNVCVSDDDDDTQVCDSFAVTVDNAAPTISPALLAGAGEGAVVTLGDTTFNDLGSLDTHTATVDWGEWRTNPDIAAGELDDVTAPEGAVVEAVVVQQPFGPPGSAQGATGTLESSHVYANDGTYLVTICIIDDDQAESGEAPVCETTELVVADQLATVFGGLDLAVDEGHWLSVPSTSFHDLGTGDQHDAIIFWGDSRSNSGEVKQADASRSGKATGAFGSVSWPEHRYHDDGTYEANLCVDDDALDPTTEADLGAVPANCDQVTVSVNNVAPTVVTDSFEVEGDEGSPVALGWIRFTDFGPLDEHTAEVTFGDESASRAREVTYVETPVSQRRRGGVASGVHTYDDNGSYVTTVCITDDDDATTCHETAVTINNVAPTVEVPDPTFTGVEGRASVLSEILISDESTADLMTVTVVWGDGANNRYEIGSDRELTNARHTYADNGTYSVDVCVNDGDDSTCQQLVATIDNAPPEFTLADTGDTGTIAIDEITDDGALDTHTATIDWGDGDVEELGPLAFADAADDGSSPTESIRSIPDHVYRTPGVYTAEVCITDSDGATVCQERDVVSEETSDWPWGVPIVLTIVVLLAAAAIATLRRRDLVA